MSTSAPENLKQSDDARPSSAVQKVVSAHNQTMAREFLDLIEPGGEFLFTLKPDPDGGTWPNGCPAHVYGTVDTLWSYVERFNNEAHRVGVFVTVNRHPRVADDNGKLRRGGSHVTAVRAVFIDVDDPDRIPGVEEVLRQGPAPNATVFTARGCHYYWLIDGLSPDRFKLIQGSMAVRFGSDRSVTDAARIMRLPGTRHVKSGFVAVRYAVAHRERIDVGELARKFGLCLTDTRPDRKAAAVGALPEGFGPPPLYIAARNSAASELGAGIVESRIKEARDAGLALANAGRLAEREAWRDLILFPLSALAHEFPEHEVAIKAAFDAVSAASASLGANVAGNDAQWDAQMQTAPRDGGRTIASTLKAAGEVNAARLVASAAVGTVSATAPPHAGSVATPPPIQAPPSGGMRLPFGGTAMPVAKPRQLRLMAPPPHRRWVLGKRLVRGETTVLAAPGGRAKSSIAVAWACSLACGKNLVGEWIYGAPKSYAGF